MQLKTTAAAGLAAAALIMSATPAVAADTAAPTVSTKALKTQKCDEQHDITVCITYRTKGNAGAKTNQFVASVKNEGKATFNSRLSVTNQKTWHNDKRPKMKPDDYAEVVHKSKKNGHACAALYVGPNAGFPEWMACIN
ncbi:hypothetical protein [Streptomyces olivaceiscleroticus]|uniref:Secreted protein n=1 Tax=Streptomyces olivaceiscleroticus TaxID=68245 RepID=A0ABP3LE20_9ACTN